MNYNKSIRYVSKSITACLILLILCTVFVINRDYINPTVTAKYFWFYILIGLLSLWIPVLVKKQRMVFSLLDFLCLLFVAYVSLNSFWAYRECSSKLMLFLLLGILYYYFRIAFTVENRLFTILSIGFIFTGCVEAIWGLGQLYGLLPSFNSSFKITGSFYNPGPYSGYLAIVFPMAFYFLLNDFPKIFGNQGDKNTIVRFRWILSLLAFSLIVVILPAGMSRASWVAVIGGSIVVLFCYIRKEDNQWWRSFKERLSKKRIWLLFALLASLILCIFIMVGMYKLKIDSADGRLLIWKNTIQMIKDNPLGVGLGYFPGQYGDYQMAYFSSGKASAREEFLAGRPDYAFNEFIQITAESGIIGLLLFVSIVIVGMLNAFRQRKYEIVACMISFLLFASMSYPFSLLPFLIVFVFLLAQCGNDGVVIANSRWYQPIISIVGMILVFCVLYNRYPTYRAYKDWFIAGHLYKSRAYEQANSMYESLKPYLFDQPAFLFEYANCLSQCQKYKESNRVLLEAYTYCCDPMIFIRMGVNHKRMGNDEEAIQYFQKASYLIPNRQYPYYLLAKLYEETGNQTKAIEMATYCLKKQPKVNSRASMEIEKEMKALLNLSNQ